MGVRTAWRVNDSMTGEDIRIALTGDTIHDTAIRARSGVIPAPSDPLKVAIGSGMVVNMNAGQIKVGGQRAAAQGEYEITNDANLAFTLANGDPAQPRLDVIVAYVRETAYSDTTDASGFIVIQGTPAASPTLPTITGTAALGTGVAIASIRVPANTSAGSGGLTGAGATITDLRVFTASPGGRVTVANYASLPALVYDGLEAYTIDTGGCWIYRLADAAWRLTMPLRIANFAALPATGLYNGMAAYALDTKITWIYDGSTWRPGGQAPLVWNHIGSLGSSFGANCTDNDGSESIQYRVAFGKDNLGFVHMRGVLACSAAKSAAFAVIGLGSGWRSLKQHVYNATVLNNTVSPIAVDIQSDPDGGWRITQNIATAFYVSFDGIIFEPDGS